MKVIELFAGIGAPRMVLNELRIKHETIGISEIDNNAIKIYNTIHGETYNFGDIKRIDSLPYCDFIHCSSPCFRAGTLVLTIDGYVPIENIKIGDLVLTHTGKYQKVIQTMQKHTNTIYKIKAMQSEPIYATGEHPFYTRRMKRVGHDAHRTWDLPEWKEVKFLDKNDFLGFPTNYEQIIPNIINYKNEYIDTLGRQHKIIKNELQQWILNEDFWYLNGRFLGDGWVIDKKKNIFICCNNKTDNELNEIIKHLKKINVSYKIYNERTVYKIQIYSVEWYNYCLNFGKYAHEKHLFKDIFSLPKNLLEEFLRGYFDADGCWKGNSSGCKNIKAFCTTSKRLAYDIMVCIQRCYNRPVRIQYCKRKATTVIEGRTVNQRDTYTVEFKPKKM